MRTDLVSKIKYFSASLGLLLFAAYSASGATFPVGGIVLGLKTGESVTLLDDGTDALKVSANGRFTFQTELVNGASYDVTVATQPTNEICKVNGGTGTVHSAVTSIHVTCDPTFSIGGTVSGLKPGDSVTLLDNGTDALTLNANGKFVFATPLPGGTTFRVTVGTEPTGERCGVAHRTGMVPSADVNNITVTCKTVPTYTVGGAVSGLRAGDSVTLLNNGGDALTVRADGKFTFKTSLDGGVRYDVTVATQPADEDCRVTRGTGFVTTSDVTTVHVSCVPTFSVGGTISGLNVGDSVILQDNHTDALTLTANGKFTFPTRLAGGATYSVTVGTEPTGERCGATHRTGKITGDVTDIAVSCTTAPTFTIGGTASGLGTGDSVTLLNNGGDALTVPANGKFTFKTPLDGGVRYDVTIGSQPAGEDCRITGGVGLVNNADVTTIGVSCSTAGTHLIGGTVSGLKTGDFVTLLDNDTDALRVSADGRFTFTTRVASGSSYNVTVGTQPTDELCTIANASGRVANRNVNNVTVLCTAAPTFTIGGLVSGLSPGASVTLIDNGNDSLAASNNGTFTFRTALQSGATYNVTVGAQPAGETCTVTNGSGTVASANVTTVSVSCKTIPTFTIGGTVSGLNSGASVTLLDDGSDSLLLSTNGTFAFGTALATGANYNVTVATQPAGETCTVAGGTGTVGAANVTGVSVSCKSNPTFTIGGALSGLSSGASVILLDNGSDPLTVTANGSFTFKTALASGASYKVTVGTQPAGETCAVTNGSGTVGSANVTNIAVSCATNTFTIGGTLSGLNTGASVNLLDNGTDTLLLSANGTFTFKTALPSGAAYNVTISTQPTGETCTITNGSGSVASANVTNVAISCATNTFTIGGTVAGLNSGASVSLLDNGTDSLTVNANGSFTFKTALASGAAYNVTIGTQPAGETCAVTNGSGTVGSANVTNIAVSCAANTFTIGGTVSGLNSGASVTLLDNSTDSLTISANGSFTFKTALASGASYNATVGTQPSGETCTVSNGAGAVTSANVTNIAVGCSSSTGGSGTFWMPFTASPVPGTTGGSNGLFVMPSNNLESSPAPQFITTATPQLLGLAFTFAAGSSPVIGTPALMTYAAAGADGNTHVYGLKIGDTSTVPTPTQISSLSLTPTQQICGFSQAQTSLADPTTVFTVLDVSPAPCGSGGDIFEVVHYLDSPSTAPTIVPINTALIYTLYQHGNLAGLILFDSAAQSLNLYADSTFTAPVQLVASAPIASGLRLASLNDGTMFGGTVAYFNVTTAAGSALYRIDSSSLSLTLVHQGTIGLTTVPDQNNLYFTDVTSSSITVFYQVPLAGGTPMVLYNGPYDAGLSSYLLQGSDDSVLAFQFLTTIGSPAGTTTNSFYTIPLGVTSTAATTIGGPYVGNVLGFVAAPPASSPVGSAIFVTILNKLAATPTSSYSSVALPFGGSTNTTPLGNAAYPTLSPNAVVQVTGITDEGGGEGGGTVSQINLSTLQGTPMTTTGGGPFVLPSGYVPGLMMLGSDTMVGTLVPFPGAATGTPQIGVIGDLSRNFLFSISLTNTNVSIF